jgi:hypothetical protein
MSQPLKSHKNVGFFAFSWANIWDLTKTSVQRNAARNCIADYPGALRKNRISRIEKLSCVFSAGPTKISICIIVTCEEQRLVAPQYIRDRGLRVKAPSVFFSLLDWLEVMLQDWTIGPVLPPEADWFSDLLLWGERALLYFTARPAILVGLWCDW